MNYYNEIDPFAAAWLRELIKADLISKGEVDERDIRDIKPNELRGYTQCHFFAGIGVWSYALRSAGWPDDRPVWTGSCPCQPFSTAGKRKGTADERHLWPSWFHLVQERKPVVIFGEQVKAAIKQGWLDLVQDDLEGIGYTFGASTIPACSVGAPHIRQRVYFVGQSDQSRPQPRGSARETLGQGNSTDATGSFIQLADSKLRPTERYGFDLGGPPNIFESEAQQWERFRNDSGNGVPTIRLADPEQYECGQERAFSAPRGERSHTQGVEQRFMHGGVGHDANAERTEQSGCESETRRSLGCSEFGDVGVAHVAGPQRFILARNGSSERIAGPTGLVNGFWRDADWLYCRDEKYRPVESGTFPLAHGSPNRVGRLRGYGNAIVAPQAQAFIEAYLETEK